MGKGKREASELRGGSYVVGKGRNDDGMRLRLRRRL
jgi:hypothetical protein